MNKKILIAIFGVILLAGAVYLVFEAIIGNKQVACTEEAKLCPDGSAVGRTGPNCEFAPCPENNDYKNISYEIEGQAVIMKDGTSTRYFGNDAIGDLNGDGAGDIAFLLTQDFGGSGTFYYVAVALKTAEGYRGTNALLLGDRIAPQTTEIRNGEIIVNYADRKLDEPMTTDPSVGISKYFKIVDNRLVEVIK
jgi:hypothetical protein